MHMSIEEKDIIKTGNASKLQIVFKDNTIISLGQKSTFKVESYLFSNTKVKARFNVKGLFKSITGKIGHIAPQNFTLKTQNATIGVRGTTIIGNSTPKKDTIICSSGKIIVNSIMGMTTVNMGEQTIIRSGKKPTQAVSIQKAVIHQTEKKIELSHKEKITQREAVIKETIQRHIVNPKKEVNDIKDSWGEWDSSDEIAKSIDKAPIITTPKDRTDLQRLRELVGTKSPSYHGKVSGYVNHVQNQITDGSINLAVDLGQGKVNGDIGFKADNANWNAKIQHGSIDQNGALDFGISNNANLHGQGDGMLSGEHLEHANGTFSIQNQTNKHNAYGIFKAGRQK